MQFNFEFFADFYDEKIPQVDSNYTCLAVITLDSALKKDENYYPQVFLKECKYIEKIVIRHTQGIEIFSSNSDEEQLFSLLSA